MLWSGTPASYVFKQGLYSYLTPYQEFIQQRPELRHCYLHSFPQVEAQQLSFDRKITCLDIFQTLRITGADVITVSTSLYFLGYSQHIYSTRMNASQKHRTIEHALQAAKGVFVLKIAVSLQHRQCAWIYGLECARTGQKVREYLSFVLICSEECYLPV